MTLESVANLLINVIGGAIIKDKNKDYVVKHLLCYSPSKIIVVA